MIDRKIPIDQQRQILLIISGAQLGRSFGKDIALKTYLEFAKTYDKKTQEEIELPIMGVHYHFVMPGMKAKNSDYRYSYIDSDHILRHLYNENN